MQSDVRFSVAISSDGRFAACGGFNGEVSLIDVATQQTIWPDNDDDRIGHRGGVFGVGFIEHGQWLVSVGRDDSRGGKLCVWNAKTGELLREKEFRSAYPRSIAVSPRDDEFAIGFRSSNEGDSLSPAVQQYRLVEVDGSVQLELVRELAVGIASVRDLSYSKDAVWLAAATDEGRPRVWELASGKPIQTPDFSPSRVWAVDFAPHATSVLAVGATFQDRPQAGVSGVHLVDLHDPESPTVLQRESGRINAIEFTSSGDQIAIAGSDKSIWIRDVSDPAESTRLIGHTAEIRDLDVSAEGTVATASTDGSVRLWRISDWQASDITLRAAEAGKVESLAFHPSNKSLFAGFSSGQITRWRLSDGKLLESKRGDVDFVFGIDLSDDGASAIICGGDWPPSKSPGLVSLIDSRTLIEQTRLHEQTERTYYAVSFLPGNDFVAAEVDKSIRIWNVETGELSQVLTGMGGRCKTIAVSRDGRYLAAAVMSKDRGAIVWDLQSGTIVARRRDRGPDGEVAQSYAVAIAPDNSTFAFSQRGLIRLCDLHTGETIKQLNGHEGNVFALDYSPDGSRLLSAGKDGNLHVWDVQTGNSVLKFHLDVWIQRALFAPDGNSIAVAASQATGDGLVRIIRIIGNGNSPR